MRSFSIVLLSATVALSACARSEPVDELQQDDEPAPVAEAPAEPEEPVAPLETMEMGLQTMEYPDFEAADVIGVGCTFQSDEAGGTIFAANEERGAIKRNGKVVEMDLEQANLDDLFAGAIAKGDGHTLTIDRAAGEGSVVGIETTAWPADLTFASDEGESKTWSGTYSCGA